MEGKLILKSSGISFVSLVLNVLFQFITRIVFLDYLGVTKLGVINVIFSLVALFSLADLGFQNAVVYRLYTPLLKESWHEINKLMSVFRFLYRVVGLVVILLSVVFLIFLDTFIRDIAVTTEIRAVFLLLAASSVASYFLAYRRALLYADRRMHIYQIIDLVCNVVFCLLKIGVIVWFSDLSLFAACQLFQIVLANLIVHIVAGKVYSELSNEKPDIIVVKRVVSDTSNILFSKLSNYVYCSTDNLVVSVVLGTASVGLLSNYSMVTTQLKNIATSIFAPIAPYIGKLLASKKQSSDSFLLYSYARFILAFLTVVPVSIMMNDFIILWIGEEFVLSRETVYLLCTDMYISIVYAACYDFTIGKGLFKQEKWIMLCGACLNIALSVFLCFYIGINGVLAGTVVTQLFFWIARSEMVIRYCLGNSRSLFIRYWRQCITCIIFVVSSIVVGSYVYSCLPCSSLLVKMVIFTCALYLVFSFFFLTVLRLVPENRNLIKVFSRVLLKDK